MKLDKVCRMCSSEKTRVRPIFRAYKRERLLDIIREVVRIDVTEGDGLPCNICKPCATTLIRIQSNLEEFRENDRQLRSKILRAVDPLLEEDDLDNVPAECVAQSSGKLDEILKSKESNETKAEFYQTEPLEYKHEEVSIPHDIVRINEPDCNIEPMKQLSNEGNESEAIKIEQIRIELVAITDNEARQDKPDQINDDNFVDSIQAEASAISGEDDYPGSDYEPSETKPKVVRKSIRVSRKERVTKISVLSSGKRNPSRAPKFEDDDPDRPKLNDHKCYICRSQSLGSAKALLEHLTTHLDRTPYHCSACTMETVVIKSVRSLNYHLKMHAQPMKCQYCDRRYCDDRARDYHVKSFHLGESAPCPSKCSECGKVCKSISALKSHMRDHRQNLPCEHCDRIFHRKGKLKDHIARVHQKSQRFECNICDRVVHSLDSYNSHLKMHMSEKTYECNLCPMKFYTAGNLGLHKRIHNTNANYKPHKDWSGHYTVTQEPGQDKIYTCKLCGKSYTKTVMKINNHLKNHFKDVKCDRCDLKFVNESQLKVHYVVHTKIREHKCDICGKYFLHKNNLTQHMKLHRNEQNYACEFCGKLFTYKEGMKAHIRNHHLRESPYECKRCRRKFVDHASLERHITAEHEPPVQQVDLGPPPVMGTVSAPQVPSLDAASAIVSGVQ
ncbi:zinc finger protein 658 isoform X1 [Aedes albopictus]|uniref:C2h2-type zn-finger protein n=1 Tax=Aedes albopictus TaxID=7160 RepID=A0ABM1Z5Z6_AEDAL